MFRPLMIAILLASAATTAQARTGPEIAYSSANEIYLINADGTGKVRVFRGKGNGFVDSVSLRKDGGAIAFVDNWVLKFMQYTAAGAPAGPTYSLPGCYRQADVQYHPDGTSVIYRELCGGTQYVKQVAVPTASNPKPLPQLLFENADIIDLGGFDGSGQSFVYSITNATAWEIRRRYLSGADVLVAAKAASGPQMRHPNISSDGASTLAAHWGDSSGPNGTGYTSEYDTASGATLRANFIQGQRADYEPNGGRIVFRVRQGRTTYLRLLDEQGLPRPIAQSTAFLAFHDVDWGE